MADKHKLVQAYNQTRLALLAAAEAGARPDILDVMLDYMRELIRSGAVTMTPDPFADRSEPDEA